VGAAREESNEAIPDDAAASRLLLEIKPRHGGGLCAKSAGCGPELEGISDLAPMLAERSTALARCQRTRTSRTTVEPPVGKALLVEMPR